jgi:uncharacterized membrane protein
MTEGSTPKDPREEPPREPTGGPEAPLNQPPPSYPPADAPVPPPGGGGWGSPEGEPPPPGWGQPAGPPPQWGQPAGPPPQWGQPGGYPPSQGTGGIAANVASGLSYVLGWITGLLFYLLDKRPEVRFHAMQSIAFGVLWTLLGILRPFVPGVLAVLFGLASFVFFVVWIVQIVQGFMGNHFKLPLLGDFAEQQATRPTR